MFVVTFYYSDVEILQINTGQVYFINLAEYFSVNELNKLKQQCTLHNIPCI
jgi:hypothetical protein